MPRSYAAGAAHGHPGSMPAHHHVTVGDTNNNSNHSTDSLSGGRPASDDDSSPAPAAVTTRAPSPEPALAITCGIVGAIIVLAVVLAIVYVRRVRRRVKNMKRRTNVLGPELAPMSPSQLSHLSPIESPCVKFDGKRVLSPRSTSELNNHLPPLSAVSVSSPMSLELPLIIPLSPIRTSTIILSPPPPARRSTRRSSNPNHPPSIPRSPIRTSRAAVPWPLITALSLNDHPQHRYEERKTSSDASESTSA